MVNNNNTSQNKKDPYVPLQNISILLNRINKILKLLDQRVSAYSEDVKNHTYFCYAPIYDSETRAQIIPAIQKELQVYHYYKKVTIRLLCKTFCLKNNNIFKLCGATTRLLPILAISSKEKEMAKIILKIFIL